MLALRVFFLFFYLCSSHRKRRRCRYRAKFVAHIGVSPYVLFSLSFLHSFQSMARRLDFLLHLLLDMTWVGHLSCLSATMGHILCMFVYLPTCIQSGWDHDLRWMDNLHTYHLANHSLFSSSFTLFPIFYSLVAASYFRFFSLCSHTHTLEWVHRVLLYMGSQPTLISLV